MSIALKNVHFSYAGAQTEPVLDIANWQVSAGEQVFLHGPSGSGKSTLLNLLGGMLSPTQGEISIMETRLDQLSGRQRDAFRANYIGYVFQQFNLINYLSAVENIQLAANFSKQSQPQSPEQLLEQLNIDPGHWHKPASNLSIGQQQRVAIARALVNQPELMIVDEPTSSLDKKNRDDFMSLLMEQAKQGNRTLVFVSHDIDLAGYFKRVEALADINACVSQEQE